MGNQALLYTPADHKSGDRYKTCIQKEGGGNRQRRDNERLKYK